MFLLLCRPLHEAWGKWFWWGASGPKAFKALWSLMHQRFIEHHNLHHLIWVYTANPSYPEWYPGGDMVDVVGMDIYGSPGASNDPQWEGIKAQFDGNKLITLAETGPIVVPTAVEAFQTMWSYFNTWDITGYSITEEEVRQVYDSAVVASLADVPEWHPH